MLIEVKVPQLSESVAEATLVKWHKTVGQAVARVPGVTPGVAMAATLRCIEENTGLTTETLRHALPQSWELEP